MPILLIQLSICVVAFFWAKWFANAELQARLYSIAIGTIIAVFAQVIMSFYKKRKWIWIYWDAYNPFYRRKEIRLSISYLFNIEVQGKYLLVRSHRFPDQFQPVGGVYKYSNPEGKKDLLKMTINTDSNIENDDVSECDLRVKMDNKHFLPRFLEWFIRGENRETDPWREFYEELVEPGILSTENFKYIQYDLVAQHPSRLEHSSFHNIDEFLYADIFTLRYINTRQEEEIRQLLNANHPDVAWATKTEIERGRIDDKRISAHSRKIFYHGKM